MIDHKRLFHLAVSIFAFVGAAAIFIVTWWFVFGRSDDANTNINTTVSVNSFAECEAAGYPVMESYPRQCSAGGKTFTEVIEVDTNRNINDRSTCLNTKQGYRITYPINWSVWKPAQGEAILTTCEAGDPIIFFAPELSGGANDQVEFSIEALNSERREGTDYEGIESLDDYLAINSREIENELTVDDQRMVQIGSDNYITFYDGVIYHIVTSNLSESERNTFFDSIEFSSTNWQPFDTTSTNNWQTYSNSEMGFSFQYPAELGDITVSYQEVPVPDLQTGKKIMGSFGENANLFFGGVTEDYSYPSEGGILDCMGYFLSSSTGQSKYYFRFPTKENTDYPIEPVDIITTDGGNILLVDDYSFINDRGYGEGPTIANSLGQYNLAGIVNLSKGDFPGLVFVNKDTSSLSRDDFEQLLSTFQFTD